MGKQTKKVKFKFLGKKEREKGARNKKDGEIRRE